MRWPVLKSATTTYLPTSSASLPFAMGPKLVLILCAIAPLHLVDDLQKSLGPEYRVKYVAERDEGSKMEGGEKLLPEDLKEAVGVLMYQFPEGV